MSVSIRQKGLVSAAATLLVAAGSAQALGPRVTATPEPDPPRAYRVVAPAPPARFAVSTPRAVPAAPVAPLPPEAPEPGLAPLATLARLRSLPSRGWFGISLRCSDCSIRRADHDSVEALEWRFREEPEILSVESGSPADHAGLEKGDVITQVGGVDITTREGGRRFGATKPGDEVEWTIDHDGKSKVVKLKAAERPDDDDLMDQNTIRDVRRELERARLRLRSARDRSDGDRPEALEDNLSRSIERAQERLQMLERQLGNAFGEDTPPPGSDAAARDAELLAERAARSRRMRYQGDIGTSHVEVRGSSRVVVTEDGKGGLVIDTPDASIHIDKKR